MSKARKDIIIATGMDNIQLLAALKESELATGVSLDRIKGLYTKFSEQKAALETRLNDQSLARLKANDDLKLAETERFFARQRAMYEENAAIADIGNGSIPASMAKRAEHGAEHLGEAAAGGAAAGVAANSNVFREVMVLVREGARKAWSRMASSFLRLLSFMGVTAETMLSSIPIIGAGIAAGLYLHHQSGELDEMQGHYGTDENVSKSAKKLSEDLSKRIAELNKVGILNPEINSQIAPLMANGSLDALTRVQQILIRAGGAAPGSDLNSLHSLQEERKRLQSELDNAGKSDKRKDPVTLQQDIAALKDKINRLDHEAYELSSKMNMTVSDRVKHEQVVNQELQAQIDLGKDLDKQKDDAAEKSKRQLQEQAEKQKELSALERERQNLTQGFAADQQRQNESFPTLQQLARNGWSWTPRSGWQRTDVGAMAHEVLFDERDQVRQRLAGNIGLANQEAGREAYLKRTLGDMGFIPKDEKWEALHGEMQSLNQRIERMSGGNKLNVNIADVSGD